MIIKQQLKELITKHFESIKDKPINIKLNESILISKFVSDLTTMISKEIYEQ